MGFGSGCKDSVSYYPQRLRKINGTIGEENGASVYFSFSGDTTYFNRGCVLSAPIQSETVTLISSNNPPVDLLSSRDSVCLGECLQLTNACRISDTIYKLNTSISIPNGGITSSNHGDTSIGSWAKSYMTVSGFCQSTVQTGYLKSVGINIAHNYLGDLRVYLTAYRPSGTNIYVMYKILSSSDSALFTDQSWQLMTPVNNGTFFSSSIDNLQEIEYAPGLNNLANNYIQYTSTSGTTYKSFIQFAIKVVLVTSDNTNVPYMTNIRALALPPGTGI
jgi:hypothetical protein